MTPVEIEVLLLCYYRADAYQIGGPYPATPRQQQALAIWQANHCVMIKDLAFTTTAKGDAQVRAYMELPIVEETVTYALPEESQ